MTPKPRCTGHCCRGFALEYPYERVRADYARWQAGDREGLIPDIAQIYPMLQPLGVFRGQELFTCKHLQANGDCGIYATRPQMCRDFPGDRPCPYRNCSSHGPQPAIKRLLNWLRD